MGINNAIKDIYQKYRGAPSLTPEFACAILQERGYIVPEDTDAQELVQNALFPRNGNSEKYGRGSPYEAL